MGWPESPLKGGWMDYLSFENWVLHRPFVVILAVAGCMCLPSTLFAQPGQEEMGEVALFGGGTFGLGSHAAVGGSSGLAFSRYGMALIEASFMPLGKNTLRPQPQGIQENSQLFDFNASFHVRIPVKNRWEPYGILGGGLLFNSFRSIVGQEHGAVAIDNFAFGFHTGGGFRYYIRETWGIRPEFRVTISNRNFTRLTVGIFYNLPPGWP
jgi:hypothetical protein